MKTLLLTLLLISPMAAEEVDPASKCDAAYDKCTEKCDQAENGSEKCYEACENTYEKCLAELNK